MLKYVFEKCCKMVYDKIYDTDFVGESKMRQQDFSRKRKFSFADTVFVVLNKTGQGVKAAIGAYRDSVHMQEIEYSQQAFSKGRMRIKWEAFRELHRFSVEIFYEMFPAKRYRGFRISAIDGSKINLPYHADTVKEFGVQNHSGDQTQALCSCLCDVLNGVVLDGILDRFDASERHLAESHLSYLDSIRTEKELILFDRGYFSSSLMDLMDKKGFFYVMRASRNHVRSIRKKSKGKDCILEHTFLETNLTLQLRYLEIELPGSDDCEYLVTNILDSSFSKDDFAKLYHMRWGIETKYNDLKNKLKIEDFSGTTPLAIRQDFYATLMLLNMVAMLTAENEAEVNRLHNDKENKYQYKANINYTVGLLKRKVVEMVIYAGTSKGRKIFKQIQKELIAAVVPVRPGRTSPRTPAHPGNKFPQNMRS